MADSEAPFCAQQWSCSGAIPRTMHHIYLGVSDPSKLNQIHEPYQSAGGTAGRGHAATPAARLDALPLPVHVFCQPKQQGSTCRRFIGTKNSRSNAQARHNRWREFLSPQGLDGYKEDLAAESPPFRLQWRDTCRAFYHDWEFRFWDEVRLWLQKKLKVCLCCFWSTHNARMFTQRAPGTAANDMRRTLTTQTTEAVPNAHCRVRRNGCSATGTPGCCLRGTARRTGSCAPTCSSADCSRFAPSLQTSCGRLHCWEPSARKTSPRACQSGV